MAKGLLFFGLFLLFTLLNSSPSGAIAPGDTIPPFTVVFPGKDGDKLLTANDLFGYVTVLFYDTRHTAPTNNDLKYAIRDFQKANLPVSASLMVVQIIDASSANVFTRTIWKRKIRENAKRYGIPIYADWTGAMRRDFDFSPKESNILIVDPKGVVRFAFQGNPQGEDWERLFKVLHSLIEAR